MGLWSLETWALELREPNTYVLNYSSTDEPEKVYAFRFTFVEVG
jgi:hypothetical protein